MPEVVHPLHDLASGLAHTRQKAEVGSRGALWRRGVKVRRRCAIVVWS